MKILHTADWHLGRTLHYQDLIEEQRFVLAQIIHIIAQHKPDVLLLAGDIYDRSVPPATAVKLLNDTIISITELGVPIIAIAGNHDSSERLDYVQELLKRQYFHIFGTFKVPVPKVVLEDSLGKVHFYCIPYINPEEARHIFKNEDLKSHEDAMQAIVNEIVASHPANERSVLMGHCFVAGGEETESERKIMSVGGSEQINPNIFAPFDYVALGHLHRRQSFLNKKVHYSGSIYKYSVAESSHEKSVSLFDLTEKGIENFQMIDLVLQKNVLKISGRIENRKFVLSKNSKIPNKNDYLEVRLENESLITNEMNIIKEEYPNAISLVNTYRNQNNHKNSVTSEQLEKLDEKELFTNFFKKNTNKELSQNQKNILRMAIEKAQEKIQEKL
jgi:DNA repair protein SbcD/Mre11